MGVSLDYRYLAQFLGSKEDLVFIGKKVRKSEDSSLQKDEAEVYYGLLEDEAEVYYGLQEVEAEFYYGLQEVKAEVYYGLLEDEAEIYNGLQEVEAEGLLWFAGS